MQGEMEEVKISIIIAVYNTEKYLKQCLDSLLEQTFCEFEIICIDDGSTDSSLMILEKYKKQDRRIQIYTQDHQYAGVARNNGLTHAKGKYTLFLDADDFLEKDSLQVLFHTAKKAETDIMVFGHYRYDTESACVVESDYILEKLDWFGNGIKKAEEIAPYIFNFSEPCAWNKLYRTRFIKESGIEFMPLKRTNDLFFSYMSLARAERICVCKKQLLYYRINNSKSLQGSSEIFSTDFLYAVSELKNKLMDVHMFKKFEASFYNMAVDTCYYNFCCHKGKDRFKELYDTIRKYMLQEIRIEDYIPNQYTDRYVCYEMHKVMNLNYEDYIEFEKAEKQISQRYYYYFPFWILPKNKNVVIYGAGNVGKSYFFQLSKMKYCQHLKMTDSSYETIYNADVCSIETAFSGKVDYVIITVLDVQVKEEIEKKLRTLGDGFKILWEEAVRQKWGNI